MMMVLCDINKQIKKGEGLASYMVWKPQHNNNYRRSLGAVATPGQRLSQNYLETKTDGSI